MRFDYALRYRGQTVLHLKIEFLPIANNTKTRLLMNFESIQRPYRPGEPIGPMQHNPFLASAMGSAVDKIDHYIETGELDKVAESFTEAKRRWEASPEHGEYVRREAEYRQRKAMEAASRPMLDPNKAAMDPQGARIVPTR